MAIANAGQYAAMAAVYGGSAAPYTRWPTLQGGNTNGVNAFLLGKSSYPNGIAGTSVAQRPVNVYSNASQTGVFTLRLVGAGTTVPARVGPVAAIVETSGPYGGLY